VRRALPHCADLCLAPAQMPCNLVHCRLGRRIAVASTKGTERCSPCAVTFGDHEVGVMPPGTRLGPGQLRCERQAARLIDSERNVEPCLDTEPDTEGGRRSAYCPADERSAIRETATPVLWRYGFRHVRLPPRAGPCLGPRLRADDAG